MPMHIDEQDGDGVYMPTPEEIRERCREIQETWSDAVRAKRQAVTSPPFDLQVVNTIESFGYGWKY